MSLLLDSARISEAETVSHWGWVGGITTNPALLAGSGLSPTETLARLASLTPGPVFYQLTARDLEGMLEEAGRAAKILGDQLVVKIMPTPAGFQAAARLSEKISCALTAVFSPAQALVAQAAGARFVIIYYHRARTLLPEAESRQLVGDCLAALSGSETHLLAASVKSPHEAIELRRAGVEYLTLPLSVLEALVPHPLSEQAAQEFQKHGAGI
ncbi:MAG: transaldolase [Anaerolineaceae bacterium]|nr:transaldolase [Anaerolineaceae bacterium]